MPCFTKWKYKTICSKQNQNTIRHKEKYIQEKSRFGYLLPGLFKGELCACTLNQNETFYFKNTGMNNDRY